MPDASPRSPRHCGHKPRSGIRVPPGKQPIPSAWVKPRDNARNRIEPALQCYNFARGRQRFGECGGRAQRRHRFSNVVPLPKAAWRFASRRTPKSVAAASAALGDIRSESLVRPLAQARCERVDPVLIRCCERVAPLYNPCTSLIYPLYIPFRSLALLSRRVERG
jgi:hypothetical protein